MNAFIPYGLYWSSPFARWQGSLSHLHAIKLAAHSTKQQLEKKGISPEVFTLGVLGTTVPQKNVFYGVPWLLGMIGAPEVHGPTISQACATGAACVQFAGHMVAEDPDEVVLIIAADRVSNGPHIYYPAPGASGGTGEAEDWVLGNFQCDPFAQVAMIETAENVARKFGISREEQDEVTLLRYGQYEAATDDFRARILATPFEVPNAGFSKAKSVLSGDEGVTKTTAAGLAKLKPVIEGGTVTYGGQTHPADGHAVVVVTGQNKARELSLRPDITIRVRGVGSARVTAAHMPMAPVPAAQNALARAGVGIGDLAAVTSHNPFALSDIVFSRETGFPLDRMNVNGCSLVWGHPQGPTGLRAMIELIEGLVDLGGGIGLFQGCAAGDSAMAVVIEVTG